MFEILKFSTETILKNGDEHDLLSTNLT